jgi:hypothetical protein
MEQKVDKGLGWLDKALNIVEKYKFRTIFKGIIIILIVAATVGFVSNPTYIFEKYKEWFAKKGNTKHLNEYITELQDSTC